MINMTQPDENVRKVRHDKNILEKCRFECVHNVRHDKEEEIQSKL
jgi:hypothetical protein